MLNTNYVLKEWNLHYHLDKNKNPSEETNLKNLIEIFKAH